MYNLEGKVAIVTGSGGEKGIGRAIAMRLAEEGADIVVNDIMEQPHGITTWGGMKQVVQEIQAMERRAMGIVADVSSASDVQRMVDATIGEMGQIDILVNNAGTPAGKDRVLVVDLEEAEWDRVLNVNVKGTFLMAQAVARHMIARGGGGKIINISSTAGKSGYPRYAAYCSSKFAVRGFTQSLAQELGPYGINVNAICPALIASERIDHIAAATAPEGVSAEEQRRRMVEGNIARTPMGRLAEVNDIARTAAFLASDEAEFLSGLSISVAGGSQMH
ncbi:MAG: glucose 1-dehydrogenase [Chloroflexota bacterium]